MALVVIVGGTNRAEVGVLRAARSCHLEAFTSCEDDELTLARVDYVAIVETRSFPIWHPRTNRLIELTQICLGNGGATSSPPRLVIEFGACSLGRAIPRHGRKRIPDFYGVNWQTGDFFRAGRGGHPTFDYFLDDVRLKAVRTMLVVGSLDEPYYPGIEAACFDYFGDLFRSLAQVGAS